MASENGKKALEEDFYHSWNRLEVFFAYHERTNPIVGLIGQLRAKGYDRQLRVGQQVHAFVLSRARKNELRREDPRLIIEIQAEGGMRLWYYEPPKVNIEVDVNPVDLTPIVEELLQRLITYPIKS